MRHRGRFGANFEGPTDAYDAVANETRRAGTCEPADVHGPPAAHRRKGPVTFYCFESWRLT